MVLGSLYLHTARLSWQALVVLAGARAASIMALAVVNAIPDFHQDRLVGKRNLVVRLGRRRAVVAVPRRSPAAGLLVVPIGVVAGVFPVACLAALLALPLLVASGRGARCDLRDAARLRAGGAQHRRLLPRRGAAAHRRHPGPGRLSAAPMNRIDAPRRAAASSPGRSRAIATSCCLHCCTESAPGKRLPDELDADEAMRVADEIVAHRRALRHAVRRRAAGRARISSRSPRALGHAGVQLKIETNGQRFDDGDGRAARAPADPLDADQPRRRHAGDLRAPARRRRRWPKAHAACRAVRAAGLPLEVTFAPTRINIHEAEAVIERARALGAFRFNTGQLMRIGTAARHVGQARADAKRSTSEFRAPARPRSARLEAAHGALLRALRASSEGLRASLDEPARDAAGPAERLGQGGGGAAAHLRRSAHAIARARPGRRTAARGASDE